MRTDFGVSVYDGETWTMPQPRSLGLEQFNKMLDNTPVKGSVNIKQEIIYSKKFRMFLGMNV